MKFLVPLVLALVGVGAGVGAGMALRPEAAGAEAHAATEPEAGGHATPEAHGQPAAAHAAAPSGHSEGAAQGGAEYVSLGDQFIVPILDQSRIQSMVVLAIDLEVAPGRSDIVYRVEPKIRDALLTVLFDHANAGGFNGNFTSSGSMEILRAALREAATKAVGDGVLSDVLITNIVRRDS